MIGLNDVDKFYQLSEVSIDLPIHFQFLKSGNES